MWHGLYWDDIKMIFCSAPRQPTSISERVLEYVAATQNEVLKQWEYKTIENNFLDELKHRRRREILTYERYSSAMPPFEACCAHDHDCDAEDCGPEWSLHKHIDIENVPIHSSPPPTHLSIDTIFPVGAKSLISCCMYHSYSLLIISP